MSNHLGLSLPAQSRLFLGIDGGGTRTEAALADEGGRILARSASGPSNPLKTGLANSVRELTAAARGALRKANASVGSLEAVYAGVAGAGDAAIRRRLAVAVRKAVPARRVEVTTDAEIALQSAVRDEEGVVVISGTGSIAYGRDRAGHTARCGGWGSLFDDAGSGYDLGRRAISAALRDYDGRGPRTSLKRTLCFALHLKSVTEAAAREWTPHEIAALVPAVLRTADRGDDVARRLCQEAGRELAEMAVTLLKRLDPALRGLPVVCAGSVFRASPTLRRSFAREVHKASPRSEIRLLAREPVEGALELARKERGCR